MGIKKPAIEFSPYRMRQLANGIKQCRHYLLWMFNECEEVGMRVSPKLLIERHASNGRFKENTIYNEPSAMGKLRSSGNSAALRRNAHSLWRQGVGAIESDDWAAGMKKLTGDDNEPQERK